MQNIIDEFEQLHILTDWNLYALFAYFRVAFVAFNIRNLLTFHDLAGSWKLVTTIPDNETAKQFLSFCCF